MTAAGEGSGARTAAAVSTGPSARIAVLVPCYNEGAAIAKVVADLRAALPEATVYVYDNASSDDTALRAAEAGAVVRREPRRGKGNVVRRMFSDIEADVYVMIDGDDSYDAGACPQLVAELLAGPYDMVVGARRAVSDSAHRPGHQFGSWLFRRTLWLLFGGSFDDLFSGQRAFSRRFVKSFPGVSSGFEIETELAVHCLELRVPYLEVPVDFRDRFAGSSSKLRTLRDGLRILGTVGRLVKEERPLAFFGFFFAALALGAVGLAVPLFTEYLETGEVPRFPTAVLVTGMMLLAFLSLTAGLVLDTVTRGRREMRRLFYLGFPAPGRGGDDR